MRAGMPAAPFLVRERLLASYLIPACLLQHWMLVFDWHHMVSFEVTWHSRAAHDTANTHNSESI